MPHAGCCWDWYRRMCRLACRRTNPRRRAVRAATVIMPASTARIFAHLWRFGWAFGSSAMAIAARVALTPIVAERPIPAFDDMFHGRRAIQPRAAPVAGYCRRDDDCDARQHDWALLTLQLLIQSYKHTGTALLFCMITEAHS